MKKLLLITGAVLAAYLILTAVISDGSNPPVAETAAYTETLHEGGYTVAEYDGRVALFHSGKPYLITDTPVASLPKADRVRLAEGIDVYSEKELKSILEDYCS